MKRIIFSAYVLLFISSLLLFSSCQKNEDVENLQSLSFNNTITVEEASTWFANDVVQKEKEMLALPYSVLPQKSPQRLFARMAKLQNKLIWSDAQLFNRNGMKYIVVPITRNLKLRSNEYELERAFVFYKNKDGHMKMNVVEVMSEKEGSLNGKSSELIAAAFYNQLTSKNETVPSVNVTVFFYNESYQSIKSYEIKAGVWNGAKATLDIRKDNGGHMESTSGMSVEAQICETFYVIYSQYENGVLIFWEILYSYEDCYNTNGDVETLEGGSGQGGGGGSVPSELENGIAAFRTNYEINSVAENENAVLQSETADTRTKEYPWVCGRALLIQARSLEYGTHIKVNNEWQWQTLTHQSVVTTGVVVGGSVSVTSHSGQATIGIYNAIMSVTYALHYNAIIPGFSPVNWSVTKTAASAWHVNY